jgi:type II secretory pathway pseudopilin PulG
MTSGARGFSLIEAVVAMAITTGVMGAIFSLTNPAGSTFAVQSEVSDQQQRLRAASDALRRDLLLAGAGVPIGAAEVPLNRFFAPVVPARTVVDGPGVARADAVTVAYVAPDSARAVLDADLPARSGAARLRAGIAGCPQVGALCGFEPGMRVLVYDRSGAQDLFTVLDVSAPFLGLRHDTPDTAHVYPAGTPIAQMTSRAYFLRTDPASGEPQLARADGHDTETPVVDHVTRLSFTYFGDPTPPQLLAAVDEPDGPWTSYGPKPPPDGTTAGAYLPGENCVFTFTGSHAPRLPQLAPGTLVELRAGQLTDGPWCPDALHPRRFDADLLRVRRISVVLRIQSARADLRGPVGVLFSRAGTSRAADRRVPDLEVGFDVAPPNLQPERP